MRSVETGTVDSFDAAVGLGEITTEDGRRFPFQCIEIADGTRTIDPGVAVAFRVQVRFGRREAMAVTRVA
jgi:cold shock CspA family protein